MIPPRTCVHNYIHRTLSTCRIPQTTALILSHGVRLCACMCLSRSNTKLHNVPNGVRMNAHAQPQVRQSAAVTNYNGWWAGWPLSLPRPSVLSTSMPTRLTIAFWSKAIAPIVGSKKYSNAKDPHKSRLAPLSAAAWDEKQLRRLHPWIRVAELRHRRTHNACTQTHKLHACMTYTMRCTSSSRNDTSRQRHNYRQASVCTVLLSYCCCQTFNTTRRAPNLTRNIEQGGGTVFLGWTALPGHAAHG